jgi:hypothetical protein
MPDRESFVLRDAGQGLSPTRHKRPKDPPGACILASGKEIGGMQVCRRSHGLCIRDHARITSLGTICCCGEHGGAASNCEFPAAPGAIIAFFQPPQ